MTLSTNAHDNKDNKSFKAHWEHMPSQKVDLMGQNTERKFSTSKNCTQVVSLFFDLTSMKMKRLSLHLEKKKVKKCNIGHLPGCIATTMLKR